MYPVKLASNGSGHVHVENGKYKRRKGMRARQRDTLHSGRRF